MNETWQEKEARERAAMEAFEYAPPLQHQAQVQAAVEASDIATLRSMSKEALVSLIIKMGGVDVALMTKQEQAEAMMHRLAEKALDKNGRETLAAINQWLDREKGKAITPIAAQIKIVDDKPIDRRELARKIEFLMSMADSEPETVLLPALP